MLIYQNEIFFLDFDVFDLFNGTDIFCSIFTTCFNAECSNYKHFIQINQFNERNLVVRFRFNFNISFLFWNKPRISVN